MTTAQFIRRTIVPPESNLPGETCVVYRWTDGRLYRCSESEWRRMKDDRRTGHNSIVRGEDAG